MSQYWHHALELERRRRRRKGPAHSGWVRLMAWLTLVAIAAAALLVGAMAGVEAMR